MNWGRGEGSVGPAMGSERRRGSVSSMNKRTEATGRSTKEFFAKIAYLNEPIKASTA